MNGAYFDWLRICKATLILDIISVFGSQIKQTATRASKGNQSTPGASHEGNQFILTNKLNCTSHAHRPWESQAKLGLWPACNESASECKDLLLLLLPMPTVRCVTSRPVTSEQAFVHLLVHFQLYLSGLERGDSLMRHIEVVSPRAAVVGTK